nr:hypothetical protein [Pandoravirus massiliensis]
MDETPSSGDNGLPEDAGKHANSGAKRAPPCEAYAAHRWVAVAVAIILLVLIVAVALAGAAARMRRYVRAAPAVDLSCAIDESPLRTGDLIITSNHNGRHGQPLADWSVPIKWITGSRFNHVAVVYVEPDTRQVLFWEINGSGTRLATVRDLTCGRPRHDIFVRRVSPPVDTAVFERAMAAQWEHEFNFFAPAAVAGRVIGCRQHRDFYVRSLLSRRRAVCANGQSDRVQRGAVHRRTCAHMVAELYHLVGVLDYDHGRRGIDPAALCAGDFAEAEPDPSILPMARGYRFGPITRLEW